MAFIYTTAIRKIRKLTKRIKVIPGGTSAGKTYGILPVLIDTACRTPRLEISVVSESIPHLRRGALKDFINIMRDTGRYIDSHFNRTLLTYTFSNGSYIEFFSADQEDRVRGPRRNILYINEANNLLFNTYHQLAIRTDGDIYIDFNPSNAFWAHNELSNDPDAEWLTLTYLDNEGLSESIVKEIEKAREKAKTSKYWENWWKVYGLGELGTLEGVVFSNWSTIDTIPDKAKLIGYGMDFGYTNDPTTLIACYEFNGDRIFDEVIYQKGLSNSELANLIKPLPKEWIFADSADPKSIDELYSYGIRIKGATKGPDSINFGVGILQEVPFKVTSRSTNLIKELRSYCWDTDREGNKLNKPIDAYNHCIDSCRYLAMEKFANKSSAGKPRVTFAKFS